MAEQERSSTVDELVMYMRRQISSGNWPVGSKIPSENQLQKELKVSRTSLRAAIMQLAALNVVKAQRGIGTFVISPLHDESMFGDVGRSMVLKKEIVQILEFLKIVAPSAIFVQLKKFNKCFKGQERQLIAAMNYQREIAYQDKGAFLQACLDFHYMIFNSIVNEFIKKSILEAINRLKEALIALQPTISTQVILTLHNMLLNSILNADYKSVRRVLKKLYSYLTSHDYLRNLG